MRIDIDRGLGIAIIHHGDSQIPLNMKMYNEGKSAVRLAQAKDPFILPNMYFDSLPIYVQKEVFDLYVKMSIVLDDIIDIEECENELQTLIGELSELVPVEDIEKWYRRSKIPLPKDLKSSMNDLPDPSLVTPDQTYIINDFYGLCAFSIAMTMLSPIFSTYVNKTKNSFGKPWKIYRALILIFKSKYYNCAAYKRLYRYVIATLESKGPKGKIGDPSMLAAIILAGISKDEYPSWMMALVVIRKVALGDVTGDPNVHSLIKYIYNYIDQNSKSTSNDKLFKSRMMIKRDNPYASTDDNGAVSKLEDSDSRQRFTDDIPILIEVYLDNPDKVIRAIDPSVPERLINETMMKKYRKAFINGDIEDGPLYIVKWVMNLVMSGRIIDYISRDSVINAIIITRCLLWHWGFYELAALSSALPIDNGDAHMLTGSERKSRVVKELSENIDKVFPYYKKNSSKKKVKISKSVQISAEAVEKQFTKTDWYINIPDNWVSEDKLGVVTKHFPLPSNFKLSLIELALFLAEYKLPDEEYV